MSYAKAGDINSEAIQSRAMTESEIQTTIRAFEAVTRRAIKAGFDGVELHGAHGFLLQNFFSPLFNKRVDRWGGDLENRVCVFPSPYCRKLKMQCMNVQRNPLLSATGSRQKSLQKGG